MRPLILLSCREKKLSQAVLPSSQSKSSLADHSRRAQCGGPVFFVLIAAFSPLYIFPLIVAHCQCWLPTMWQLPTETCLTFFFFFLVRISHSHVMKAEILEFLKGSKKKKTLVKLVCATWLHIIWFPNSKPKSVCLRENTALGLHPPRRVPVSERPSKRSLSYDIIPNERFCVFSRVLIWAILKPPLANVWDEKTAVVDQQRYHNVNVSGSRQKKKSKRPLLAQTAPFTVITPEISLPERLPKERSEPRLDGPFQRTLHQFAFHGLFKTTLATISVGLFVFFIHLHVKAANSLFLFREKKGKKLCGFQNESLLLESMFM